MNPYSFADFYNTAEGGINGSAITTANSGGTSGSAFDSVQSTGTAAMTYSSSDPLRGGLSWRFVANASGYANVRWTNATIGNLTNSCGAIYVRFDSFVPSGSVNTFLLACSDDADTIAFRLKVTDNGALRLSNANNSTIDQTTATMSLDIVYRVEWQVNHTSGDYVMGFYAGDNLTPIEEKTGSVTPSTVGSQTRQIRVGVLTVANSWSGNFDNLGVGNSKVTAAASSADAYASAVAHNTAEGGTNGTGVTAANSGGDSGRAFNSVQVTGANSITYSSSSPIHNSLSYRIVGDGSGYANLRWLSSTVGSLTNSCGAVYVKFDPLSGGPNTFFTAFQDDTDSAQAFRLRITASGSLQILNATSSVLGTTTSQLNSASTYRIEWQVNHTSGNYVLEFFSGDSTTAVDQVSGSGASFGTSTQQVRFGVVTVATWSATFDSMAVDSSKIGAHGGTGSNPPTVDAGADQSVTSYSQVTLTANASDPDAGDTVTVTWSQSSGTPTVTLTSSGATASFTSPAVRNGTTLGFEATASDGTNSDSDTVSVTVSPHNEWAVQAGVEQPIRVDTA